MARKSIIRSVLKGHYMNKDTEKKQKYLTYFKKMKAMGKKPESYGSWAKAGKDIKAAGGSHQTRRQMGTLSKGDREAVLKMRKK